MGICAKCDNDLFPDGDLIGEICHIEAYSPGGNRYNKNLKKNNAENLYENLIVLCSNCHKIVDLKKNEEIYDRDYLYTLKTTHKTKGILKQQKEISDLQVDLISKRFSDLIEIELQEIKIILNSITGNYSFSLIKDTFNRKNSYEPSLNNLDAFYYSKEDIEIIETIKKGTTLEQPQSYILIGPPSSGKTTLVLKLISELSDLYTHFYR